jgi:hypothetical protein
MVCLKLSWSLPPAWFFLSCMFCSLDWGLVESISKLYSWELRGLQIPEAFYLAWMKSILLCVFTWFLLIKESDSDPCLWDEFIFRLLDLFCWGWPPSWDAKMSAIENCCVNILLLPLTPIDFRELKVCCRLSSSKSKVSPRSCSMDRTDSSTLFLAA